MPQSPSHARPGRRLAPLAVGLAALLAVACGQERQPAAPPTAPPPPAPSPPTDPGPAAAPAPAPAPADGIIARAGALEITASEVRALVAPRVAAGEVPPSPEAIRGAVHELAMARQVAAAARAERFEPPAELDPADDAGLAAAFLDARAAGEVDREVDDDDLAAHLVERRRASVIVLDARDAASELQTTILAAIAAEPERATTIFAEIRAHHPLTAELKGPPPDLGFDLQGLAASGQTLAHRIVAQGAFALPQPGAVSPPVQLGPNRFALVQLLAVEPARSPAELSGAERAAATEAIIAHRVAALRGEIAARATRAAPVKVVDAEVAALAATLGSGKATAAKGGSEAANRADVRRLRMERFRRLPNDRRPAAGRSLHPRLRDPRDKAKEAKNPVGAPTEAGP